MPNRLGSARQPSGKTGDAAYKQMLEDRDRAANLKAAMLAHRDAQYRTSGLFHETVVHEDGSTITRLRT